MTAHINETMRSPKTFTILCVVSLILASCASDPPVTPDEPTPSTDVGTVVGVVRAEDTTDVVSGVAVMVGNRSVITDAVGSFVVDSVPAGPLQISVSADDRFFAPTTTSVQVDSADTAEVEIVMLRRRPSDSVRMVAVGSATFRMGNDKSTSLYALDAIPRHTVTLTKGCWVAATEVSQKQWNRLMYVNPSPAKNDVLPVTNMVYDSVIVYCNRLSDLFGLERVYSGYGNNVVVDHSKNGFRLLTEAEWEYACAAGDTTTLYGLDEPIQDHHDGDYARVIKQINAYAWTEDNTGGAFGEPKGGGLLQPNAWGLYDMIGNVSELVEDNYSRYTADAKIDPLVRNTSGLRVSRGSSFGHLTLQDHTIRHREYINLTNGNRSVGFRIGRNK